MSKKNTCIDCGIELSSSRPKRCKPCAQKHRWADPELRLKLRETLTIRWQDPAFRQKHKESMDAMRAEPEYRQWLGALMVDPEYRRKHAEAMDEVRSRPGYGEKISRAAKEMWTDPAYRAKHGVAMDEVRARPEYRQKVSESSKSVWADPEFRKRWTAIMKVVWASPEYREAYEAGLAKRHNLSGKEHHWWRDGASLEAHPPEFSEALKRLVRERDGLVCALCGGRRKDSRALDVHHIDGNKQNNTMGNLLTLCQSCHMIVHHGDFDAYKAVFQSFLANDTEAIPCAQ